MPTQATSPLSHAKTRGAICVADGYHITVRVHHGRLVVEDGFATERRKREYSRATEPISRLVVIGTGGSVSLEALALLRDVGASFLHLGRDGRLISCSATETPDARLRRAQALSGHSESGLDLARSLLRQKLDGQCALLKQLPAGEYAIEAFAAASEALDTAATIGAMVEAEREAALAYWSAWADVEMRFRPTDRSRVPHGWTRFGQRTSPISSSPRLAVNPANAILNYLYALLEAEARVALLAVGLDPGIGVIHADVRGRDSLALDVMETARPDVDRYLHDLLQARLLAKGDFTETRRGDVRINSPLTRELADTTRRWARLVAPVAEHAARSFAHAGTTTIGHLTTPLTRQNRTAGHAHERARLSRPRRPAKQMPACKRCDRPVPNRDRTYCGECVAAAQRELYAPLRRQRHAQAQAEPAPASEDRLDVEPTSTRTTSRRCKVCGEPVPHRKRVRCDACFADFQRDLAAQRKPCKRCGQPVPHRKRALCDSCLTERGSSPRRDESRPKAAWQDPTV